MILRAYAILALIGITLGYAHHPPSSDDEKAARAKVRGDCVERKESDYGPSCDPAVYLKDMLQLLNKSENVSDFIKAAFQKGVVLGAQTSHSLQRSEGMDDPRLYFDTRCGTVTTNLMGDSIEMAILNQKVDASHAKSVGAGLGKFNIKNSGEILIEIGPFPRKGKIFKAAEIVNGYAPDFNELYLEKKKKIQAEENEAARKANREPRKMEATGRALIKEVPNGKGGVDQVPVWHDSKKCSRCHVDVAPRGAAPGTHTASSLGLFPLTVGEEDILAIVSPYGHVPGQLADEDRFCVPKDLQSLHNCLCQGSTGEGCKPFKNESGKPRAKEKLEEACLRLKETLALAPRNHCDYDPRDQEGGKCLIP